MRPPTNPNGKTPPPDEADVFDWLTVFVIRENIEIDSGQKLLGKIIEIGLRRNDSGKFGIDKLLVDAKKNITLNGRESIKRALQKAYADLFWNIEGKGEFVNAAEEARIYATVNQVMNWSYLFEIPFAEVSQLAPRP